jgi:hypothetical protein
MNKKEKFSFVRNFSKKCNLRFSIAFERIEMMKKSLAIHVLCESVANSDTEAELRQNHVT